MLFDMYRKMLLIVMCDLFLGVNDFLFSVGVVLFLSWLLWYFVYVLL